MAQIYVPGPCELHVGTGSSGSLQFLGWSESGVRASINREWDDVPADIAGTRMPADVQFMGEQAYISCDLKVFNNPIFNKIASAQNPFSGTRGNMPYGSLGKLMVTEGAAYRLLVYSPYAVLKPAMSAWSQLNFFTAWLAGPDDIPNSTKATKIRALFRAIASYNSSTGEWDLYDQDISGKPAAA
jgi:hypothetical protein